MIHTVTRYTTHTYIAISSIPHLLLVFIDKENSILSVTVLSTEMSQFVVHGIHCKTRFEQIVQTTNNKRITSLSTIHKKNEKIIQQVVHSGY